MSSKMDYLKRYMSRDDTLKGDSSTQKKKRKKWKKKPVHAGLKIIDTEVKPTINVGVGSSEDEFTLGEEKPQIAGVVDERPLEMTGKWKRIEKGEDVDRRDSGRRRHDSDSSLSEVDSDFVVERKLERSDGDESPPRATLRDDSPDMSPPRRGERTLEGKKAGLQDAKGLKQEMESFRSREKARIESLSDEVSGRKAETQVRGRLKEKEEAKRKKAKALVPEHVRQQYEKWGRGLAQIQENRKNTESELHEMGKPLARAADDEDLDAHLKAVEREDDPMLAYIKKKKKAKPSAGQVVYPEYLGPQPPPNRFGIRPGYRWDGVDRSTGFEKRLFEAQSRRVALAEESYKWSTEDM